MKNRHVTGGSDFESFSKSKICYKETDCSSMHVLRTDGDDRVKNVLLLRAEAARQRGRPRKHGKRLWTRI